MELVLWRALVTYYNALKIQIKYEDQKSELIKTSKGVKQGGILSGYLFNRFIDSLLRQITDLNIGCRLGTINTSILGYCDDIELLSITRGQVYQTMLNVCQSFAKNRRIKFNIKKSACVTLKHSTNQSKQDCQTRSENFLDRFFIIRI